MPNTRQLRQQIEKAIDDEIVGAYRDIHPLFLPPPFPPTARQLKDNVRYREGYNDAVGDMEPRSENIARTPAYQLGFADGQGDLIRYALLPEVREMVDSRGKEG